MKNFRTKIAAAAIAVAALIAAPAAANAYTPVGPGSTTIAAGGTGTVVFDGSFDPGVSVSFYLEGESASSATLAYVKFAVDTSAAIVKTADASGSVSVQVTLPSNATGEYTLYGEAASGSSASATIIAIAASDSGDSSALAVTGADASSMSGLWIGGGVLLAGGIAVTVIAMVRRRQEA